MPNHAGRPLDRTRRRLLRALPGVAAVGLGATTRSALALTPADTDALLTSRLGQQGVGLVAVQVEGASVDLAAKGLARQGVPLRTDDRFEIGSITKTFTALLLADAVVRKQLALADAVEDALPGIRLRDNVGAPIRWVDLATHRSGLPRLPDNMLPREPADPYADYDEARLLDFLRGFKATEARDVHWSYSNLGFGLMGYALGRRAGKPYPSLLAERVLRPLGMNRSALALTGSAPIAGLVEGHDPTGRPAPHWRLDVLAGAGALVMDGTDIARYAQAALGIQDSPLREAFALAQREHAPGPTPGNPMGLAWIRASLNGRAVLNHDGGTAGFSSSLWLDPNRGRAAAVLANAMVEVNDLALHLLDETVPTKDFGLTKQAETKLSPDQLAPLAGTYVLSQRLRLGVTVRDGELWAQATGQGAFQLFAKDERHFFAKVTPLEIAFDAGSPSPGLSLQQGGQTLRFVRE